MRMRTGQYKLSSGSTAKSSQEVVLSQFRCSHSDLRQDGSILKSNASLNRSCENLGLRVLPKGRSFLEQSGETQGKEDAWQYGHVVTLPRRPRHALSHSALNTLTSDSMSCLSASSGYASSSSSSYGSFKSHTSSLPRQRNEGIRVIDNPTYDLGPMRSDFVPLYAFPEQGRLFPDEEGATESLKEPVSLQDVEISYGDPVAEKCREFFERREKQSKELHKRWNCKALEDVVSDKLRPENRTLETEEKETKESSMNEKMKHLRNEIASLMKQDDELFKQLLALHDSISALKGEHVLRPPSPASMESFTEEDEEEDAPPDEAAQEGDRREIQTSTTDHKFSDEENSDTDEGLETDESPSHSPSNSISHSSTTSSISSGDSMNSPVRDTTRGARGNPDVVNTAKALTRPFRLPVSHRSSVNLQKDKDTVESLNELRQIGPVKSIHDHVVPLRSLSFPWNPQMHCRLYPEGTMLNKRVKTEFNLYSGKVPCQLIPSGAMCPSSDVYVNNRPEPPLVAQGERIRNESPRAGSFRVRLSSLPETSNLEKSPPTPRPSGSFIGTLFKRVQKERTRFSIKQPLKSSWISLRKSTSTSDLYNSLRSCDQENKISRQVMVSPSRFAAKSGDFSGSRQEGIFQTNTLPSVKSKHRNERALKPTKPEFFECPSKRQHFFQPSVERRVPPLVLSVQQKPHFGMNEAKGGYFSLPRRNMNREMRFACGGPVNTAVFYSRSKAHSFSLLTTVPDVEDSKVEETNSQDTFSHTFHQVHDDTNFFMSPTHVKVQLPRREVFV